MELVELAKRVRAGVKFLDKKFPQWRNTLRQHSDEFDLTSGAHCVLGTLEHHNGRLRILTKKLRAEDDGYSEDAYSRALTALKIEGEKFGFDADWAGVDTYDNYRNDMTTLNDLWRAEFE